MKNGALREIDRRISAKTQLKEQMKQQAIEEAKEVNILQSQKQRLAEQVTSLESVIT